MRPLGVSLVLAIVAAGGLRAQPASENNDGHFRRTRVIGYSQVGSPRGGWFVAGGVFESIVGDDQWELLWAGGAGVDRWRDANYHGWSRPLVSPCPGDKPPDRVLLSVSGPYGSDEKAWADAIAATVENIRQKIPSARQIILQPVVGGPDGKPCPPPGRRRGRVRASWQHKHIENAIQEVVGKYAQADVQVVAGYSPRVRTCDDYADGLGHLKPEAAEAVGRKIGEYYASDTLVRSESFDRDPGWEGRNNRIAPKEYPTIVQDFGYSKTNHAGRSAGEMGGQVQRASEPAYYAARIGPKTLDDRLSASGTFALTKTTPGAGIFFGFFRADQPGGGGRPIGSLGLNMDCESSGARLAVRLITGKNQSCGTFTTPFLPGKFRPTPIRNDGTRYAWTLDYDPEAADGRGRFTFTLRSEAHQPGELESPDLPESHREEARRRFPSTTTFSVDLPEGYKEQETTFDHFGLMNMMKVGGRASIYFDDLRYDGRSEGFSQDPNWDASGNRVRYQATDVGGAHNFGFSDTNHAGGEPGEVGGTFWRAGPYGYYADRVGSLTLDDRLEARGKVVLKVGGPDSDMYLGWFNSENQETPPLEAGHFLGVHVGGPTRVGHYFHPAFTTATGARGVADGGPVLEPGTTYEWSLIYDPAAERGQGAIRVTLGEESVTLPLKQGTKAQGARFDRFGLFTSTIGGQLVKVYLDDLQYTACRRTR